MLQGWSEYLIFRLFTSFLLFDVLGESEQSEPALYSVKSPVLRWRPVLTRFYLSGRSTIAGIKIRENRGL